MPLAARPATAPVRPGRMGAPYRRATSKQASGPVARSGIATRHTSALLPTNRAPHVVSGMARSSASTARPNRTGAAASARLHGPSGAAGRAIRRSNPMAVTASVTVTTNLKEKRTVCKAWEKSGRKPRLRTNSAPAMSAPTSVAMPRTRFNGHRTVRSSASALIKSSVFVCGLVDISASIERVLRCLNVRRGWRGDGGTELCGNRVATV